MWKLLLFCLAATTVCNAFKDPVPNAESRIVGGTNAQVGAYPWQLSLELRQLGFFWSHICGAVLIDENTALTAAHCVEGSSSNNLRVIAGTTDRSSSANKQTISISSYVMHPGWDTSGSGYPNDIAVLKLQSSANTGSPYITPVALAPSDNMFVGNSCTLTGWGATSGGGSAATWLQEVTMPVIGNSACAEKWSSVSGASINDGHICIFEQTKSACSGDSGGPMTCNVDGTVYLAGITSWGVSSCNGEFPSVYSRVSYFLDFINSNA